MATDTVAATNLVVKNLIARDYDPDNAVGEDNKDEINVKAQKFNVRSIAAVDKGGVIIDDDVTISGQSKVLSMLLQLKLVMVSRLMVILNLRVMLL